MTTINEEIINEIVPKYEELKKFDENFKTLSLKLSNLSNQFHLKIENVKHIDKKNIDDDVYDLPLRIIKIIEKQRKSIEEAYKYIEDYSINANIYIKSSENIKSEKVIKKISVIIKSVNELKKNICNLDFECIEKNIIVTKNYLLFFHEYENIEQMNEIRNRFNECKLLIMDKIKQNFFTFFKPVIKHNNVNINVKNIIKVIHILNNDKVISPKKLDIIKTYIYKGLNKYETLFKQIKHQGLLNFNKRFSWIDMYIANNKKLFDLFPNKWYFIQEAITEFCLRTLVQLKVLLESYNNQSGIKFLSEVILQTRAFEKRMDRKYKIITRTDIIREKNKIKKKIISNEFSMHDTNIRTPQDVQKKYEITEQTKKLILKKEHIKKIEKKYSQPERNYKFVGQMSQLFDLYVNKIYISYYTNLVKNKLQEVITNKNTYTETRHIGNDFFEIFETTFKEIILITNGKTLFTMFTNIWNPNINTVIIKYLETFKSQKNIFDLINFLNLCIWIIGELNTFETLIKNKILSNYKNEISFEIHRIKIKTIVNTTIEKIVISLIHGIFKNITMEFVKKTVDGYSEKIFKNVSYEYSQIFIYKLTGKFITTFCNNILKSKFTITNSKLEELIKNMQFYKKYFKDIIKRHDDHEENKIAISEIRWKKIDVILSIFKLPNDHSKNASKIFLQAFTNQDKDIYENILRIRGWNIKKEESKFFKQVKKLIEL